MQAALEELQNITIDKASNRGCLIDVVVAVTGKDRRHAAHAIAKLCQTHDDLCQKIAHVRINGKGKPTPVADAPTCVEVVWLTPGNQARAFRKECAQLLCRVLGGDLQIAACIERQHNVVEGTKASNFLLGTYTQRQLALHSNTVCITGSGTIQTASLLKPGVYIVRYGPRLKLFSSFTEGEVLGFGYTRTLDQRQRDHNCAYGISQFLDFFPTYNTEVEANFKKKMRLKGRLCEGIVDERSGKVTELFWVADQNSYMEIVKDLQNDVAENPHPAERHAEQAILTLQTKLIEAETRREEARAAVLEAEARREEAIASRVIAEAKMAAISTHVNDDEPIETVESLPRAGFYITEKYGRHTPVEQVDLSTGAVLTCHDSMESAARVSGCSLPDISTACTTGLPRAGCRWRVKKRWVDMNDLHECTCHKPCSKTYQVEDTKVLFIWPCKKQLCAKLRKHQTSVNAALRGARPTMGGYFWYKENNLPVNVT